MGKMVPDLNNALANLAVTFRMKAESWEATAKERERQRATPDVPGLPPEAVGDPGEARAVSAWYRTYEQDAMNGFAYYSEGPREAPSVFADVPSYYNVFQEAVSQQRAKYSWDHAAEPVPRETFDGMQGRFKRTD